MRALAAVFTLAVWSCRLHARAQAPAHNLVPRALLPLLGITENSPVHRILDCSQTLGPSKCLSALSLWRAENAIEAFEKGRDIGYNVTAEVKRFPWERYSNSSDEQLYSQLCDSAERLLQYRSLSLTMIPGYTLELDSKGNGTLNVDILKNDVSEAARGSKLEKKFYNILPLLMVPGLIMSAILPFVLPALKLTTVAVGILNNMALSGAVFTLLRNNAFNDHYEKRIIYVNEGYKNEKMYKPVHYKHLDVPLEDVEVQYSSSNAHGIVDDNGQHGEAFIVEGYPSNEDWIKQYYGNGDGALKLRRTNTSQRKSSRYKSRM